MPALPFRLVLCRLIAAGRPSRPRAARPAASWCRFALVMRGGGICAIVLLNMVHLAQAATEVRLRSQARCPAAVVRLGDVAEIFSDDLHLAEILADIPLRPSPQQGASQRLSRQEVQTLLVLSGVAPATLQMTGSSEVVIQSGAPEGPARPRQRGLVAEGVRQAVLQTTSAAAGQDPAVRQAAGIKPPSPSVPRGLPAAAAEMAGSAERPLVERGAQVSVLARTAGIRITTSGKALEAGKVGERIQVELDDSKQRVLARVVGWQAVEVTVGEQPSAFGSLGVTASTAAPPPR